MSPPSSERRRLKYTASINDETLGEDTDADYELQYVDIGNVDAVGNVYELATYRFAEAPSRARRRVRDGDVIISTVRTYLQAIAPIHKPTNNLIVSTGFAVVRAQVGVLDAAFCKYALREPSFLAEVERRSVGVSYPTINASDLGGIPIYLPALPHQRALITRAVTYGLDARVPLRKSGIPWLGQIPAHWETRRLAWLFRERDQRGEPDLPLLEVSINAGVVRREFLRIGSRALRLISTLTRSPG